MSLGGSNTTTTTVEQPAWLQNAMQDNISRAGRIANQPYQRFPGPRIADFTEDQQNAMELTRQSVGQSAGAFDEARDFLRQSAQGVNPERMQAATMQAPQLAQAMGYNPGQAGGTQISPAQGYQAASVNPAQLGSAQGYQAGQAQRTSLGPAAGFGAAQVARTNVGPAQGFSAAQAGRVNLGGGQGYDAAQRGRVDLGNAQGFDAARSQAFNAGTTTGADAMGAYDNPFTSQVIDRTMGDLDRAEDRQLSEARRRAAGASSFGGSRTAILESEIMRDFDDRRGDIAADLRSQGFNTALQAGQTDAGRMTDTSRFNAGQQTQVDEANAARQNAARQFAAQMGNEFALTQGQMDDARLEANAGRQDAARRFGADVSNQFDLTQGQMDQARAEANAGRSQQARSFGAQANNQFGLTQAEMDAARASQNAGLSQDARRFGADSANQFRMTQGQMDAQRREANAGRSDAAARFAAEMGNTFAMRNADFGQQAALDNASRMDQAGQFTAGAMNNRAGQQAQLDASRREANAGRSDAAARFAADMGNNFALQQAGMDMEAAGANMGAINNARQFNAGQSLEAQLADRANAFTAGQGLMGIEGADRAATNQDIDRLMNVGDLERRLRQGGLDLAVQDFNRQRDWDMRGLNALIQATGNIPSGMFGSTSQEAPSNTLGQLGSAASGIASIAGMFSDRRLKQDITPLGGGVYEYAYVWDPAARHVGVMADEVPARFRIRGMSGFDMVDYGLMALEAA